MGGEPTVDQRAEAVSAGDSGHRGVRPDLPMGVLVGRYITTGVLGRGGMGVVYSAHDPVLRRPVALKLLHSAHPVSARRLIREAQALARLSSSYVVAVYDAGEYDGDQVFIAMQHVDGQDLASVLAQRRPSRAQILGWFIAAGRGLAAAHAAGLVHRDFKPANVLLDRGGNVAVTDFGLAREVLPNGQARQTSLASLAGTPAYMSPEQHDMQPATQASDQFSFCLALWEALFEQHPYLAKPLDALSTAEIGSAIFASPLIPPPPVGDVPRRVIEALVRGLERDPAARWESMPALLAALTPVAQLRRWPIVFAGLAGACAATAGALVVVTVISGPTSVPAAPPGDDVPVVPAAPVIAPVIAPVRPVAQPASPDPGPVVAEPATVTLQLAVDPPGAAVTVDGAPVQGPELVVPRDTAAHLLRITAAGYVEHGAFIKFDASQRLVVHMKRAPRPSHGRNAPDEGSATGSGRSHLIESQSPYE